MYSQMFILLFFSSLLGKQLAVPPAPFECIEDLRFGGDFDDGTLIWGGSLTHITAGQRGHIFIADTQSDRILEFDQNGVVQCPELQRTLLACANKVGIYGFGEDGGIYVADTSQYRITKWPQDLKEELQVFQHDYKPIHQSDAARHQVAMSFTGQIQADPGLGRIVTQKVIEKALTEANLPSVKPPVFARLPFWQGHMMAVHDIDLQTRGNLAGVFSPQGHDLVRLSQGFYLPGMRFRGNHAFTIETNDQGDLQAVRYRIKKLGGTPDTRPATRLRWSGTFRQKKARSKIPRAFFQVLETLNKSVSWKACLGAP